MHPCAVNRPPSRVKQWNLYLLDIYSRGSPVKKILAQNALLSPPPLSIISLLFLSFSFSLLLLLIFFLFFLEEDEREWKKRRKASAEISRHFPLTNRNSSKRESICFPAATGTATVENDDSRTGLSYKRISRFYVARMQIPACSGWTHLFLPPPPLPRASFVRFTAACLCVFEKGQVAQPTLEVSRNFLLRASRNVVLAMHDRGSESAKAIFNIAAHIINRHLAPIWRRRHTAPFYQGKRVSTRNCIHDFTLAYLYKQTDFIG